MSMIDSATLALAYKSDASSDPPAGGGQRAATEATTGERGTTRETAGSQAAASPTGAGAVGPRDPASFNLESLAAAVGLDPDELLNQVKSGQGISELLGPTGQTGFDSTVADSVRGGIMLDRYA